MTLKEQIISDIDENEIRIVRDEYSALLLEISDNIDKTYEDGRINTNALSFTSYDISNADLPVYPENLDGVRRLLERIKYKLCGNLKHSNFKIIIEIKDYNDIEESEDFQQKLENLLHLIEE